MSKRKVLLIVENLPVPFDRRVWAEAQALAEGGYQVSVICPNKQKQAAHEVLQGISIYRYRPPGERGGAIGYLWEYGYSLLAALCGTPWQPSARGCILFAEDVGEAPYRVDRLFRQLELAGVMDGVAAIALGQFTDCGTEEDTAQNLDVLRELAARHGVPAVLGLPIGHVPDNWTLPLGVRARLDADAGTLSLLEPAVEGVLA